VNTYLIEVHDKDAHLTMALIDTLYVRASSIESAIKKAKDYCKKQQFSSFYVKKVSLITGTIVP
jgi:hypothetical protein